MAINSDSQWEFLLDAMRLVFKADENDCKLTIAWAYRPPWVQAILFIFPLRIIVQRALDSFGIKVKLPSSKAKIGLHTNRQAIDFNLFTLNDDFEWVYQQTTAAHRPLGIYWESLSTYNRWGGRFKDGNHYERRSFPWQEKDGFIGLDSL